MVCEASRFASWVDANQERFAVHGSAFTVRGSPFTGAVRTSVDFLGQDIGNIHRSPLLLF